MKHQKMLTAFAMLIFLSVNNIVKAQVQFSPKVGLNFSSIKGEVANSRAEGRIGWHAGADLRIGQSTLYFKPGVHFQSFTARLVEQNSTVEFRDETKINFLKMPLNVGLNLTKPGGFLEVHVHGGLVPNVLLGVKERPNFSFNKESLKIFNLGANAGVDVDLSIFTINAQYEWGITKFFEQGKDKNNIFSIGVGFNL